MRIRTRGIAAAAAAMVVGGAAVATAAAALAGAQPAAAPSWRVIKSVKTNANGDFTAVVATGKATGMAFDEAYSAGGPTAWRRNGSAWTRVAFPGKPYETVIAADATSPSDVWAFTDAYPRPGVAGVSSRVLRWNGKKWSVVKTFAHLINGASFAADNDIWVFGDGLGALRYNGHTWTVESKTLDNGGSVLASNSAWAFSGTSVYHWIGTKWAAFSVKSLLPAKSLFTSPAVSSILALSPDNVYAVGNGNTQDVGGPTVVLHFNGRSWSKVASGNFGSYGTGQNISTDGKGGLWLPMPGASGRPSSLLHYSPLSASNYSAGTLTKVALPVAGTNITITSVARIPGTSEQLAGGFTHGATPVTNVTAVLLQYS